MTPHKKIDKSFQYHFFAQIVFSLLFLLSACKKSENAVPNCSLNVINAASGINTALVRTPNVTGYFSQITGVNYGASAVFNIPIGSISISMLNKADTTKPLYNTTVNAAAGDVYSYFIAGAAGEDVVSNKDNIPVRADSSFGLRFINLNYNSPAVNVALSSTPTTNEFSGIAYKALSDFKRYGTRSTDPSTYTFQVSDAGGNILASANITSSSLIQKNITLVFSGMIGGSGTAAPRLFTSNNF